jgi:hypothetical protein
MVDSDRIVGTAKDLGGRAQGVVRHLESFGRASDRRTCEEGFGPARPRKSGVRRPANDAD